MPEPSLRPGDVLLSLGKTALSEAIQQHTGGPYAHAALWSGEQVIESTLPAARALSLEEAASNAHYLDAFRHLDLGDRASEVITDARQRVGHEYDVDDLVLMSALATLTAWLHGKCEWLEWNTPYQARRAIGWLGRYFPLLIAAKQDRATCVELVVNAHLRAGLPVYVRLEPAGTFDARKLEVAVRNVAERMPAARPEQSLGGLDPTAVALQDVGSETQWIAEVLARIEDAGPEVTQVAAGSAQEASVSYLKTLRLPVSMNLEDEGTWYSGFVTPRQLATSPSFECRGTVVSQGGLGRLPTQRLPPFRS